MELEMESLSLDTDLFGGLKVGRSGLSTVSLEDEIFSSFFSLLLLIEVFELPPIPLMLILLLEYRGGFFASIEEFEVACFIASGSNKREEG